MPTRANGYQATSGFVTDSTLYDSNTATGYERTTSGGSISITGKLDLGAAPTAAKKLKAYVKWADTLSAIWEYSDDDVSYAAPVYDSSPSPSGHSCVYSGSALTWVLSSAASHRYWRLSVKDTANTCDDSLVGLMELEALDASDVHIAEAGGAQTYLDTPQSKGGGKASEADVFDAVDAPRTKGAGKSSLTGGVVITASVQSKGAGKSSLTDLFLNNVVNPPTSGAGKSSLVEANEFVDTPQSLGGGKSSLREGPNLVETFGAGRASVLDAHETAYVVQSKGGGKSSLTVIPTSLPALLFDEPQTRGGGRSMLTAEVFAAVDVPRVVGAGKVSLPLFLQDAVDTPQAKGAGRASLTGGVVISANVQAKGAGKSSDVDRVTSLLAVQTKGAGKAAQTEIAPLTDTVRTQGAGKSSQVDVEASVNAVQAKGAGKSTPQELLATSSSVQSKGAGKSAQTEVAAFAIERPQAKGGGKASQTDQREIVERPQSKGAGKSSNTSQLATADVVQTKSGGRGRVSAVKTSADAAAGLIPALRRMVKATLTEVQEVPEGFPSVLFGDTTLALPYLVIEARDPRPDDTAVFSQMQVVPVDLALVVKTTRDSSTDTPQSSRARLDTLALALLRDFRLAFGGSEEVTVDINLLATPYSRETEYQALLREKGEDVTVLVLAIECRVNTDTL